MSSLNLGYPGSEKGLESINKKNLWTLHLPHLQLSFDETCTLYIDYISCVRLGKVQILVILVKKLGHQGKAKYVFENTLSMVSPKLLWNLHILDPIKYRLSLI